MQHPVVGVCLRHVRTAEPIRVGQYGIRINQQWRICFQWTDAGPGDVEITDCH